MILNGERRKQNAKVKMQNLFFVSFIHQQYQIMVILPVQTKERIHLRKKLESLQKIKDVRLFEDVESTKRMQDVRYLKVLRVWTQQKPVGTKDVIKGSLRIWTCCRVLSSNFSRTLFSTCIFTLTPKACTKTFVGEITLSFSARQMFVLKQNSNKETKEERTSN